MKDLPIVDTGTKRVIENAKIVRVKANELSRKTYTAQPKQAKRKAEEQAAYERIHKEIPKDNKRE